MLLLTLIRPRTRVKITGAGAVGHLFFRKLMKVNRFVQTSLSCGNKSQLNPSPYIAVAAVVIVVVVVVVAAVAAAAVVVAVAVAVAAAEAVVAVVSRRSSSSE